MNIAELQDLLHHYDVPLPRYTSYPTVPYWNNATFSPWAWKQLVQQRFEAEEKIICLYIHLPFCEELCTYCACNKRITKNHAVEEPYLHSVLKEWEMYLQLFGSQPIIKEIHLGGGTPTFFSPKNLRFLIESILQQAQKAPEHEFSVEVHPNYTTYEHLYALRSVGFNRISLGVQDFDPKVQYVINRLQSFQQTEQVVSWARQLGYESVNIDLVYGLPWQRLQSIELTINQIALLKPDRIAFYSYAHVPWKSKAQRRYTDEDVPKAQEKISLYSLGYQLLTNLGYIPIGMDHFALPSDKLFQAYRKGQLHRNFMGYTTTNHKLIIGLGMSSISDAWNAFAQNDKTVEGYEYAIAQGELPLVSGHLLTQEDLQLRQIILQLMCRDTARFHYQDFEPDFAAHVWAQLKRLAADELVLLEGEQVKVLPKGKLLIRHVCAAFDAYLYRHARKAQFSKAI
ncbi:MAG: oxygen-independent coproporphyrinogen III oxidase [Cytophagales bacterium]|nr:oxygen-independent coproporphyrinogen III oxidase [Bernardetiaceae bacterium]MDW8211149.1 oxygen-independent coproporphyrinogen III oxidase [Cytophagales bacterium]